MMDEFEEDEDDREEMEELKRKNKLKKKKIEEKWQKKKNHQSLGKVKEKENEIEDEDQDIEEDDEEDDEDDDDDDDDEKRVANKEYDGEEDDSKEKFTETGERIVPFNLKEEQDEGKFDESGNFIWKKREKDVQEDAWLEGHTEDHMQKAMEAREARERQEKNDDNPMTVLQAHGIIRKILSNDSETVLQALRRLGKKKSMVRGKKRKADMAIDVEPQSAEDKRMFEELTDAADCLMREGQVDAYEYTLQNVREPSKPSYFGEQHASQENNTPQSNDGGAKWEYKATDGKIYGPYTSQNFVDWKKQGYFTGQHAVPTRKIVGKSALTQPVESKSMTAEEELLKDMEDGDDDAQLSKFEENVWVSSDNIDFELYA